VEFFRPSLAGHSLYLPLGTRRKAVARSSASGFGTEDCNLSWTMRLAALLTVMALSACTAEDEDVFRLVTVTVEADDRAGLTLRELPKARLASLKLGYGLAVVRPGTVAERAGLRTGDVVYGVNLRTIHSLQDFAEALAQPVGGHVMLLVRRGKRDFYLSMALGPPRSPRPPATDTLLRI
jgi:hypothetical protein